MQINTAARDFISELQQVIPEAILSQKYYISMVVNGFGVWVLVLEV
jgi:hypothetical protein